jgi:hypothetical protein
MSHLIEEYSKSLGVKISKPIVSRHFYPVMFDNYITIQLAPEISAKKYHYYEIVIDLISSQLRKLGISIVQVGATPETKLKNVDISYGKLRFKNTAYIVSKSKLHIGVDDALSHYANSVNVPQVTLFGNVFSSVTDGYWCKSKINIEAPWSVKPCLSNYDPEDSINKILPETIASAILKSLKLDDKVPLKTLFTGRMYHNKIVEIVPNFFNPSLVPATEFCFLRLDWADTSEGWTHWFQHLNRFAIITDKFIPIELLDAVKHKIHILSFVVDEQHKPAVEYLELLKKLKIQFHLLVKNPSQLAALRYEFFDYSVQEYGMDSKDLLPKDFSFKNAFFNSSKTILSNNKKYNSRYHLLKDETFLDKNFELCEDEVLLEELKHFYVYSK